MSVTLERFEDIEVIDNPHKTCEDIYEEIETTQKQIDGARAYLEKTNEEYVNACEAYIKLASYKNYEHVEEMLVRRHWETVLARGGYCTMMQLHYQLIIECEDKQLRVSNHQMYEWCKERYEYFNNQASELASLITDLKADFKERF